MYSSLVQKYLNKILGPLSVVWVKIGVINSNIYQDCIFYITIFLIYQSIIFLTQCFLDQSRSVCGRWKIWAICTCGSCCWSIKYSGWSTRDYATQVLLVWQQDLAPLRKTVIFQDLTLEKFTHFCFWIEYYLLQREWLRFVGELVVVC